MEVQDHIKALEHILDKHPATIIVNSCASISATDIDIVKLMIVSPSTNTDVLSLLYQLTVCLNRLKQSRLPAELLPPVLLEPSTSQGLLGQLTNCLTDNK